MAVLHDGDKSNSLKKILTFDNHNDDDDDDNDDDDDVMKYKAVNLFIWIFKIISAINNKWDIVVVVVVVVVNVKLLSRSLENAYKSSCYII